MNDTRRQLPQQTFTGLYSDILPAIEAMLTRSQAKRLRAEVASGSNAATVRTTPMTFEVTLFPNLGFTRVAFGYEGKAPLETLRIGRLGGLK